MAPLPVFMVNMGMMDLKKAKIFTRRKTGKEVEKIIVACRGHF
ncbi:hypothetical protein [Borreliella garinii]